MSQEGPSRSKRPRRGQASQESSPSKSHTEESIDDFMAAALDSLIVPTKKSRRSPRKRASQNPSQESADSSPPLKRIKETTVLNEKEPTSTPNSSNGSQASGFISTKTPDKRFIKKHASDEQAGGALFQDKFLPKIRKVRLIVEDQRHHASPVKNTDESNARVNFKRFVPKSVKHARN